MLSPYHFPKNTEVKKMLVISRKPGESIMIGDQIEVSVERIERGIVRIGISAPDEIKIHRTEVYEERRDKPKGS
jgi:carbon storage regulator